LPPSSGFIVPLPSVFRPNRYTNLSRAPLFAAGLAALIARAAGFAALLLRAALAVREFLVATLDSVRTADAIRPAALLVPFFAIDSDLLSFVPVSP
jgi:hypothetical protein